MKNLIVGYAHRPTQNEEYVSRFGVMMPLHPHYFNVNDQNHYYGPGTDLKFTLLSAEEEARLFKLAKENNDQTSSEFLITNHLLFAATYARRLVKGKLPDNEVISAANYGLMKAFEAFNHKLGKRFAAYAKPYIRSEIASLWRSKDIVDYHGNFPDTDGDNLELLDAEAGVVMPDVEGDSKEFILRALEKGKKSLTAQETKILRMFYEEGLNFREIGDDMGVCRERIRAAHANALEKLRRYFKTAGVDAQGEV